MGVQSRRTRSSAGLRWGITLSALVHLGLALALHETGTSSTPLETSQDGGTAHRPLRVDLRSNPQESVERPSAVLRHASFGSATPQTPASLKPARPVTVGQTPSLPQPNKGVERTVDDLTEDAHPVVTAALVQPVGSSALANSQSSASPSSPAAAPAQKGPSAFTTGSEQPTPWTADTARPAPGTQSAGLLPQDFPTPLYPPLSRRLGEEGRVLLRVWLDARGQTERVEVRQSSGFQRLDAAAVEAAKRWRPALPVPLSSEAGHWQDVPIRYSLR